MPEVDKALETPGNGAPQSGAENNGGVAPASSAEVDLSAELEEVRKERDNYKKGMLQAKGKLPEDAGFPSDPNALADMVKQQVQEALNNSKDADFEARERAIVEKALKENRELKLAAQNRSQLGKGAGQGASQEASQPVDNFFSAEQLADLKKRKLDPEQVKKNIIRNRQ